MMKPYSEIQDTLRQIRVDVNNFEEEISKIDKVPSIQLALFNRDFPTGPLPEQVMRDVIAKPAYWAFC